VALADARLGKEIRRIEELRPRIAEITRDLLDAIGAGGEVDPLDAFAFPLPIMVMSLLPGTIEEFLRYQGPLRHATFRFTREPVELGGVVVPEGELVMLGLASANRDDEHFAEPDRLDIRRDTAGHLAFGHGIHYCLGAPLARLEAEIAFTGLLGRFGTIEPAVPRDELRWRPGNLIRGLARLPVRSG
jgi:cytochrome P450